MARNTQDLSTMDVCERCQSVLDGKQEICGSCGKPTKYMSFKTRAEYEVEQWRTYKQRATTSA